MKKQGKNEKKTEMNLILNVKNRNSKMKKMIGYSQEFYHCGNKNY